MLYRILIADDRAVVRQQLRNWLELAGTISVVGEAVDGWDAIRQTRNLNPDIVLMDLEMPELDGFEATIQIKSSNPTQVIVIFTVYVDEANKKKALKSGADAFISKGTDLQTLMVLFEELLHRKNDLFEISKDK